MQNELTTQAPPAPVEPGFNNADTFALLQRAAKLLSSSTLVPPQYRSQIERKEYGKVVGYDDNPNAIANCVIALNIARRMRADELMVMQNLYIVEGRPAWSSQWVIAAVNTSGKFSPLRFDIADLGPREVEYSAISWVEKQKKITPVKTTIQNLQCIAWAREKETGERVESPPVTMEMAVAEGWFAKNGSKWQTMPQVMLRYRAASFFGKIYAPELLMGLPQADEVRDYEPDEREAKGREVPPAKVPLLPETPRQSGDAAVDPNTLRSREEEPPRVPFAEFWQRATDAGWDRQRVLNILFEAAWIKSDEDVTEAEAAKSLAVWPEIVEMMGGAA